MNAPGGLAAALALAALQAARPVSPPTRDLQESVAVWYERARFERVPAAGARLGVSATAAAPR